MCIIDQTNKINKSLFDSSDILFLSCVRYRPHYHVGNGLTYLLTFTLGGVSHWAKIRWYMTTEELFTQSAQTQIDDFITTRLDPAFDGWPKADRDALEQEVFDLCQIWLEANPGPVTEVIG